MTNRARFWDKIAVKYARDPVKNEAAYQAKLDITQSFFTPQTHIFEYGCGTGTTSLYHAPKVGSVLATDISENMLAIARDKLALNPQENIEFKRWNIDTDPLPEQRFDMVMAHSVLHLVVNLPLALRRSHDMLEHGGIFISSTACLGDWNPLFRPLIAVMKAVGKAPPVNFIKKDEFHTAIKETGFEILPLDRPVGGDAEFIVARKV